MHSVRHIWPVLQFVFWLPCFHWYIFLPCQNLILFIWDMDFVRRLFLLFWKQRSKFSQFICVVFVEWQCPRDKTHSSSLNRKFFTFELEFCFCLKKEFPRNLQSLLLFFAHEFFVRDWFFLCVNRVLPSFFCVGTNPPRKHTAATQHKTDAWAKRRIAILFACKVLCHDLFPC